MSELNGILFFPVTPFAADGTVDTGILTEHLRQGLGNSPGGVFAACGTGEFHALAPEEYETVVRTAVKVTDGQVPVFAGSGGPLPVAIRLARLASDAGADGLLLMPPYLVDSPPSGLVAYVTAIASATSLPVIVYHRGNARFDPASAVQVAGLPTVTGLKDGLGDLDLMAQIVLAVQEALPGKPFQFFNGLPTAEVTVPAYRGIGVRLYSSAAFCFAPEVAVAFHRSLESGDYIEAEHLLSVFFHPLTRLRRKVPGYAVSLVKAGVRLRGLDAGSVRAPLIDPSPADLAELQAILDAGLAAVGADGPPRRLD
jgi:5-dehydro-4-deoxyglucarate dehydratase